MSDYNRSLADEAPLDVVLEGGPPDLPNDTRIGRLLLSEKKLKIQHRNGYEHFELVDGPDGAGPAIFRWTMRTKIAE